MRPVYFCQLGKGFGVVLPRKVKSVKPIGTEAIHQQFQVGITYFLFRQIVEIPQHVILGLMQPAGGAAVGWEILEIV